MAGTVPLSPEEMEAERDRRRARREGSPDSAASGGKHSLAAKHQFMTISPLHLTRLSVRI